MCTCWLSLSYLKRHTAYPIAWNTLAQGQLGACAWAQVGLEAGLLWWHPAMPEAGGAWTWCNLAHTRGDVWARPDSGRSSIFPLLNGWLCDHTDGNGWVMSDQTNGYNIGWVRDRLSHWLSFFQRWQ